MKAIAPGKLILSGEHAVVQGCPALVTAVSRHASAEVHANDTDQIRFVTPFGEATFFAEELRQRLRDARERYGEFLAGQRPIRDVVPTPLDFVALGWPLVKSAPAGIRIRLDSTIPPGSGMGSSAAVSAALLHALSGYAGTTWDRNRCRKASLEMETFQHGRPSGVDSFVSVHGGMIRYVQESAPVPVRLSRPSFLLVQTGTPESTTGECVEQVRRHFAGSAIWDEFSKISADVERALTRDDPADLVNAVRRNHRLLVEIGVVPKPVADWIERVEGSGGGAKICGAGSVRGDAGGIVWVVGDVPLDSRYTSMNVKGERDGVRFVG